MNSTTILLVEDNEDDAFFMKRALRDAGIANPVRIVEDGQQAIDYLRGGGEFTDRAQNPLPMIVFLDLKLPFKSGHEVLEWIRQQPQFAKLIVIVLTSSNEPVDLNRAYKNGANSYVVKPPTPEQLTELAKSFELWWLKQNTVGTN
jgi:CheY-like chemotaxis protein